MDMLNNTPQVAAWRPKGEPGAVALAVPGCTVDEFSLLTLRVLANKYGFKRVDLRIDVETAKPQGTSLKELMSSTAVSKVLKSLRDGPGGGFIAMAPVESKGV